MSVRKRGDRWWYDFTIEGKRYRRPIPQARGKRKAEEIEDKAKVAVYEGTYNQPKPVTMGEFITKVFWPWAEANYRTPHASHYFHMLVVKEYFASTPLKNISPLLIERFKRDRMNTPSKRGVRKPATVNRDLQMLARILSMARDNGLIKENPSSKVKLLRCDNERTRYLTDEEEIQLLEFLRTRNHRLEQVVRFALNTGMRRGEIIKLMWSDVDFTRNVIQVRRTKSGKDRSIPINDEVRTVLEQMQSVSGGEGRVFTIAAQTVSHFFRFAVKELGFPNLVFHDLRHAFATRLGDAGIDPFTIAELTGHSDLKMVKRYTHALEQNKRRAVEMLSNRHKSVTSISEKREKTG